METGMKMDNVNLDAITFKELLKVSRIFKRLVSNIVYVEKLEKIPVVNLLCRPILKYKYRKIGSDTLEGFKFLESVGVEFDSDLKNKFFEELEDILN